MFFLLHFRLRMAMFAIFGLSIFFLFFEAESAAVSALRCGEAPSISARKFVCYFPNWAGYRHGEGKFGVEKIDPFLCTHLVYSFAFLDPETLIIKPSDVNVDIDENGYGKFADLKKINPELKTMIALGGWVDSNMEDDTADKYSRLVSSKETIRNFVGSVINFMKEHRFDGLDVDWEYPRNETDKQGFTNLINELKKAFQQDGFLLSTAIPTGYYTLQTGFDLRKISKDLDFINLMAYDLHGSWEPNTADHHSNLVARPGDRGNNIEAAVDYLLANGVPPQKIILGIPTYGRSWELSSNVVTPPCPANGAGDAGEITGEKGILGYNEICKGIKTGVWTKVSDPTKTIGPYAYTDSNPKQWVGFDDIETVENKSIYLLKKGLGGAMVWDIAMDDFNNVCGDGKNPLLMTIAKIVV